MPKPLEWECLLNHENLLLSHTLRMTIEKPLPISESPELNLHCWYIFNPIDLGRTLNHQVIAPATKL